ADAELGGRGRIGVDIELRDGELALVGLRHLVQDRREHLAGSAPFGPEIDQHRVCRLQDILVEGRVRNMLEVAHRAFPFAFEFVRARRATGCSARILMAVYRNAARRPVERENGCDLLKFNSKPRIRRPSPALVAMTYVVTESCIRCKYTDCVDVCPVDCFREGPNFLVIDPDECIDCTLCVAECPVEAIFAEDDVPEDQQAFKALNAELSKAWKPIIERKPAPPDADEWKDVREKLAELKRRPIHPSQSFANDPILRGIDVVVYPFRRGGGADAGARRRCREGRRENPDVRGLPWDRRLAHRVSRGLSRAEARRSACRVYRAGAARVQER